MTLKEPGGSTFFLFFFKQRIPGSRKSRQSCILADPMLKKRIFGSPAWALGEEDLCVQDFQIRVKGWREGRGRREGWIGGRGGGGGGGGGFEGVEESILQAKSNLILFPLGLVSFPHRGNANERTRGRVQFKDKTTTK